MCFLSYPRVYIRAKDRKMRKKKTPNHNGKEEKYFHRKANLGCPLYKAYTVYENCQ